MMIIKFNQRSDFGIPGKIPVKIEHTSLQRLANFLKSRTGSLSESLSLADNVPCTRNCVLWNLKIEHSGWEPGGNRVNALGNEADFARARLPSAVPVAKPVAPVIRRRSLFN